MPYGETDERLESELTEKTLTDTTPSIRVKITAEGRREPTFDAIREAVADVLEGGED